MKIYTFPQLALKKMLETNPIPREKLLRSAFIRISSKELMEFPFDNDDEFIKENVIEFSFCDIEEDDWESNKSELIKAEDREEKATGIRPRYSPITEEEAKEIVKFVKKHVEKGTRVLFIHCDAGVCRSNSVAYAIAKYILKDEEQANLIENSPHSLISSTITSKIKKAVEHLENNRKTKV